MMVNLAISGLGGWGQSLVDSVENSEFVRFTAAVTRTPSNVSDYCAQKKILLTDDYHSVLNDINIDAIVIATPHTVHFDQILMAAEAGKHVFCEKPFTLTAEQSRIALRTLADRRLKVAIGHNRRFAPNTQQFLQTLKNNSIGQPIHIDGLFNADLGTSAGKWRDNRAESPAGGMTSLGIHLIDSFIHLFGKVSNVSAQSRKIAIDIDIDDSTLARLNFENGCSGQLTTIAATSTFWQVRAFGTQGWAECTNLDQFTLHRTGEDPVRTNFPGFEYPSSATMKTALEAFAADIIGDAVFPISPDEILHATAVLEAIIISTRTGQTVEIADIQKN
jgi:predicted dehydrogenase